MRDFINDVNATPLTPELFGELVEVSIEAKSGKRRALPPDAERIPQPGALYLADCPENQMGMSIVQECRRRFADDRKRAQAVSYSFLIRWFAIAKAREQGRLKEFIKPTGDGSELVHSAIFDAAADAPVNAEGDFDECYIDRARAIKAAEDAEQEGK